MSIVDEFKKHLMVAGIKVTPPAGISLWLALGNTLDTWIKAVTLIYIVGQIGLLGVRAWLMVRGKSRLGESDD